MNKSTTPHKSIEIKSNSFLEKLSWIASILSLLLGAVTWIFPTPINISKTSIASTTSLANPVLRICLFSIFCTVGIFFIIYSAIKPKGHVRFVIRIFGDWYKQTLMLIGMLLMFITSCAILGFSNQNNYLVLGITIIWFILGTFMTVSGMKNHVGLIQGESSVQMDTPLNTFLLITIFSLLITGIIVFLLLKLIST